MSDSSAKVKNCGTGRTVSLPVAGHGKVRKSRNGPRRALVLLVVNLLMIAHLIQWLVQGMTLSPVEPSESMYTLELGQVNAGFIFFCAAILATFIFGRFFCGWGCHVVALQDSCTWLMEKCGVRPRPFRSRLLMLGPLLLALLMFVWPTFKRMVLVPVLDKTGVGVPIWIERPPEFPGFTSHLMTEDFWATFPAWYIAIPFLLVCGFATVYLLGSKGFCTYGCPYGGFFAPVDKVALGGIVVSDACEGCGHCTAVCTSNVRVHQEVRDFGRVVDPGCMKCLDCVSVCPNGALSFSFARPAVLTPRRTPAAIESRRPRYDLSWTQEVVFFIAGIALFIGFRGLFDQVPLLMAAGLASIGVFGLFKVWQLLAEPNSRVQSLQLKIKGRWTVWGLVCLVLTTAYTALGAWGGYVKYHRWQGDLADIRVNVPMREVFSRNYKPRAEIVEQARVALHHLRLGGSIRDGGHGWKHLPKTLVRIAWLHAVCGDLPAAERAMREAVERGDPNTEMVIGLAQMMELQGKPAEEGKAMFEAVLARKPELYDVRLTLGIMLLHAGHGDLAAEQAEAVLRGGKTKPRPAQVLRAAALLTDAGKPGEALAALERAIQAEPTEPEHHFGKGQLLLVHGEFEKGLEAIRESIRLEPDNPIRLRRLAGIYRELGRAAEAEPLEAKAAEIESQRLPARGR